MDQDLESDKVINYSIRKEILLMSKRIIDRYSVCHNVAYDVALRLYQNGIGIQFFQPIYYQGKFDLDEIVNHLLKKIEMERKIIPFCRIKNKKK